MNDTDDARLSAEAAKEERRMIRRTIKDLVFTTVFKERINVATLYKDLHPEHTDVSEEDVEIVTLENVISTGETNDLGFVVNNRLLCLVEAQTVRMKAILLRNLVYLADTYKRMMQSRNLTVYDVDEKDMHVWEMYVIYPRDKGKNGGIRVHMYDSIPRNLFDLSAGKDIVVDTKGLINDYANVCGTIDRIITEEGNGKKALRELIEECRGKDGIIERFIVSRETEIMDLFEEMWTREGSIRACNRY